MGISFKGFNIMIIGLALASLATGCLEKRSLRQSVVRRSQTGPGFEPATAFAVTQASIQTPHYRFLLSKLSTTLNLSSPQLSQLAPELINRRTELGDYDLANGVSPNLVWNERKMVLWMESLAGICASAEVRAQFVWPQGAAALVKRAYGRQLNVLDEQSIAEISADATVASDEKLPVYCLTVLSSLEFVSL